MRPILLTLALSTAVHAGISFEKHVISTEFVAEGASVADFDGDGHLDIAAGPYIWFGPTFEKRVAFRTPPPTLDPVTTYSDAFLGGVVDLNGDGKPDIVQMGFPGKETFAYLNPGKGGGEWKRRVILASTDGESPGLGEITANGKPSLVCFSGGSAGYADLPWGNEDKPGVFHAISKPNPGLYQRFTHGQGFGDLNGDGRPDIVDKTGWFEQPAAVSGPWPFHPFAFSNEGGAQMLVFDVNGDGRKDVVTSLNAHGYGISWFEQKADGSFVPHPILVQDASKNPGGVGFSQPHAMAMADINGDGIPDLITGKRHYAHGDHGDPEPQADAVLYWFETKRDGKGGAEFIPHEIDRASGVGTQVTVMDMNGDKKPDIVVANKNGVFVFLQKATP